MAVYDLEEQEQISALKGWWEDYGNWVTGLIAVAALAAVGWQGWQWYQGKQAGEAGVLYFAVQQAVEQDDAQKARDAAGQLIGQYPGTTHAQMGALLSAGVQFHKGELDNAKAQLAWAAEKGADPALRDLARLRLATVLQQQGALDEALVRLQPVPAGQYKARFEDLKGDVLATQGKSADARVAYQAAMDAIGQDDERAATLREVVRVKLESLEG